MKKNLIKLTENDIHEIVKNAVKKIFESTIRESDDFQPHGYHADSNWGGKEVQISDSGDAARFRSNYGDGPSEPTDWMEIQFDENGVAYVDTPDGTERLDQYMRY